MGLGEGKMAAGEDEEKEQHRCLPEGTYKGQRSCVKKTLSHVGFYVPSCHCRNGQEPGENVLSFPGSCVLKERIGQGPMVTNKDRGGLLIKRTLLSVQMGQQLGRARP